MGSMKVEDARAALERIVNNVLPYKHTGIMVAADALGDARELRGLDAAESAYAQHYDGANEGDAVALAIEAIRTRIKGPVKEVTHDDD